MIWVVDGADAATGVDKTIRVDAESREAAENAARMRGLLVTSAWTEQRVPNYNGMVWGSRLLVAMAKLYYVAAFLCIMAGFMVLAHPWGDKGKAFFLPCGVGMAMLGVFCHAAGTALEALRDIARNSFSRS